MFSLFKRGSFENKFLKTKGRHFCKGRHNSAVCNKREEKETTEVTSNLSSSNKAWFAPTRLTNSWKNKLFPFMRLTLEIILRLSVLIACVPTKLLKYQMLQQWSVSFADSLKILGSESLLWKDDLVGAHFLYSDQKCLVNHTTKNNSSSSSSSSSAVKEGM